MQPLTQKELRSPGVETGHYRGTNSRLRETRFRTHRMPGGKAMPACAVKIGQSESGMIRQSISLEVDPVQGRLATVPYLKVVSVMVPVQAMHALKHPQHDYPGSRDVIREQLKSGAALFDLEAESEITQRLGINPRYVGGTKFVCESARLAYIAAVNFLARRMYDKATQQDKDFMDVFPALYNQTVLDRFGGVLDPDDRINGVVEMELLGKIPIEGMGIGHKNDALAMETTGEIGNYHPSWFAATPEGANNRLKVQMELGIPQIYADLANAAGGGRVSMQDLYLAERHDALIRRMRKIVDNNAQYGEEMLADWAMGLEVDPGKQPFVLYERRVPLQRAIKPATDGPSIVGEVEVTDTMGTAEFAVPIPKTEFGGVVITLVSLLPDETVGSQPHPRFTQDWRAPNFVLDEQKLDPVPVDVRDMHSDVDDIVPMPDEQAPLFYVGNNHLHRTYVDYGFGREVDPMTVENRTAIWQVQVPLSVTPENVFYPDGIDQYPWALQNPDDDICTYHVRSVAVLDSPLILGPSPVEEIATVELNPVEGS